MSWKLFSSTLAKQQIQFPLLLLGSAEQITKSFRHVLHLPPHLRIWPLPHPRDVLHIKHSVILNKCVRIISFFKEERLLMRHFSQLQRELSFLQPHSEELLRSALLTMSFWCVINTSSHVSDIIKCTCQWRLLRSWYFKENEWPSLEIHCELQWPQLSLQSSGLECLRYRQLCLLQVTQESRAHWQSDCFYELS